MKKAIINGNIVTENGIIFDGVLLIDGDTIARFGREDEITVPDDAEIIDANGAYVGPGLVDIHVHGGEGLSTAFDTCEAAKYFLSHGATSILATPFYVMNFDEHMKAIENIKQDMAKAKNVRGIYFEGPYTNPNYGCKADMNPWRDAINMDEARAMVDAAGKLATVWTVAPEREGIAEFMKYAREVNPNVEFAVGHSEATPEEIRALGSRLRPTIMTHCMNATGRVLEKAGRSGRRGYGPDEYCYGDPEMYAELISDSGGIHVHPDLQQMLVHIKGVHRVILITDCTTMDGCPSNLYQAQKVDDLNFDHNGGLAGSKMTMDKACRNIMMHTRCGIAEAFLMGSTNPAKAVGLYDERGSIDVGKKADLVIVSDRFDVKKVILGGEVCEF
jgi:N-acetylglucosamine-6-phosphate deacetylase